MFSISEKSEDGFDKIFLEHEEGCYAAIVPSCGAILQAFGIKDKGPAANVIDGFADKATFDRQVEEAGFNSCKLSPFVCRMKDGAYTFGENQYQIADPWQPPHALHGLLYNKSFSVTGKNAGNDNASLELLYEYRGQNPGYPFHYDCKITYTLLPGNALQIITECINQDKGLMPIQDGWHPYFTLGEKVDQLLLEFQATEKAVFNNELLPTGEWKEFTGFSALEAIGQQHLDNSFHLNFDTCQPMCVLRNKEAGVEIQIFPERSYSILQIYTPEHRKSIAIENISGLPNGFNQPGELITLESGSSAQFQTMYKINMLHE